MRLPSVTEVLGVFSDFSCVPARTLEEAQRRGTAVHQACGAIALGIYQPPLQEEWRGYVESFRLWFDTAVRRAVFIEKKLTYKAHGYTGTPDMLVMVDTGLFFLVDLKTPVTEAPTWKAQIAAYVEMLRANGYQVDMAGALKLDKGGKVPRMITYQESTRDFNAFLSALNAYRYFKQ